MQHPIGVAHAKRRGSRHRTCASCAPMPNILGRLKDDLERPSWVCRFGQLKRALIRLVITLPSRSIKTRVQVITFDTNPCSRHKQVHLEILIVLRGCRQKEIFSDGVAATRVPLKTLKVSTMSFFAEFIEGLDPVKRELRTKNRAARKIQRSFKNHSSKGEFEEKRGAAIFLQAAARRKRAQSLLEAKKNDLRIWAAMEIQDAGRRMILRKAAKKAAEDRRRAKAGLLGMGVGTYRSMARSLSFTKKKSPEKKPKVASVQEL